MKIPKKRLKLLYTLAAVFMLCLCSIIGWCVYSFSAQPAIEQTINYSFSSDKKAVFEPVLPGVPVTLPQDFSFHNEFLYDDWHYFANLVGNDGKQYSVQWNYFRLARDETRSKGWNSSQIYMAQTVITSEKKVWRQQRIARGGIGQAGLLTRPFRLWIDNWNWRSIGLSPLPGILTIDTDDVSLQLHSSSFKPFLLNGENGYTTHHDLLPLASYGFQMPFIRASGQLILEGQRIDVGGQAWLSKEWGSDLQTTVNQKEIKINLHLDDGRSLQLNQNRIPNYPTYSYGMIVNVDGSVLTLSDDDISMMVLEYNNLANGKSVPLKWKVKVNKLGIEMTISPQKVDMWHAFYNPYWQGTILAMGSSSGYGMLELTGY